MVKIKLQYQQFNKYRQRFWVITFSPRHANIALSELKDHTETIWFGITLSITLYANCMAPLFPIMQACLYYYATTYFA
jgi:hypothetical protein